MISKFIEYIRNKKENKLMEKYKLYGVSEIMNFEDFKRLYESL